MELLAPAGSLLIAKIALYSGADAIYLAVEKFGARAYAKNLTFDELKEIIILAHQINKKIYVTVNTIIKEEEFDQAIDYLNKLYELGADGIIVCDLGLIDYMKNNLEDLEIHISTQAGVKDFNDAKFFYEYGAKRVVIARETPINEIKEIKNKLDIEVEVFAHGALCVSYSGGCLFSSLLTLRSGNRGRCSQNCRRYYKLYENDNKIGEGYLLSMKDLNTSSYIDEIKNANIDSLKLEGRMKNESYVKTITEEYRKLIDIDGYKPNLSNIFHRIYTKGFLFNEDRKYIVDSSRSNNEGSLIGNIIEVNKLTKIKLKDNLNVGDRIRIGDYYFTVDEMFDNNMNKINTSRGIIYLKIFKKLNKNDEIYKMVDSTISIKTDNKYKKKLNIKVISKIGSTLKLFTTINNIKYYAESSEVITKAKTNPITYNDIFKQLSKLNDTSFYIDDIDLEADDDIFIRISSINEARRNLINKINENLINRSLMIKNEEFNKINYDKNNTLVAHCTTIEQYNAAKDMGIDVIYFNNYSPYLNNKYKDIDEDNILISNFGGLLKYKNKNITTDYTFNVINARAVYMLHKLGVKYVTPSIEASYNELKNIYNNYDKYGNNPNLEIIVYGKIILMNLKYCPLKQFNKCGECKNNKYYLKDDFDKFYIDNNDCYTKIYNNKALNLIDELKDLSKISTRFRLNFTTEDYNETKDVILMFKNKINNIDDNKSLFDGSKYTRGYFKREIL